MEGLAYLTFHPSPHSLHLVRSATGEHFIQGLDDLRNLSVLAGNQAIRSAQVPSEHELS